MKRAERGRDRKSFAKHSLNRPGIDGAKFAVPNNLPSKIPERLPHALDEFIAVKVMP
jgi:hypothetical protein